MLDCLVDVLNRRPDVGAAFCNVEVVRPNTISSIAESSRAFSKLLAKRSKPGSDEVIFSSREMYVCLLEDVPIKPTGVLIRREVLDAVGGYNESWSSGEDWELYLRISKRFGFGYVDRKLATMRVMKDSTLSKFQEADKLSLLQMASDEKKFIKGDREAIQAVNRAIARHHQDLGWMYRNSGRRAKSVSTYGRGFAETGHFPLLMRMLAALVI